MNILSIEFTALVLFTAIFLHFFHNTNSRVKVLLASSCLFYAWWDVRFLILLLLYTIFIHVTAIFIERERSTGHSRLACMLGVAFSVLFLGFFKYFNFFMSSLKELSGSGFRALNVIIPIGISFFTLSAIGYLIDVYRGDCKAQKNFCFTAVFISYFPKLLSGPIERASSFFHSLENPEGITPDRISTGIQIITFGIMKKIVIADRLGVAVDAVFAHVPIYSAPSLICAAVSYTLQIYCDFSGYTDIAVGVSHILGIPLLRNFNLPYCSSNPSGFWKRWHISLSSWFRDYLYIPLGGSRRGGGNFDML